MSLFDWVRTRLRQAGAPSEGSTRRDGFLSYAAETHAIGYGLGLGTAIALRLAGVPYILELTVLALGGVKTARVRLNERVLREIREEPQYFLPAVAVAFTAVGYLAGLAPPL